MGNKNPVHKFKKGVSGNPSGRPKGPHTTAIRKMAALTHEDLVTQASDLWTKPVSELADILKDATKNPKDGGGQVSAGRAVIASVLMHAIKQGDPKRLDAILNRIVGRPAETIKLLGAFAHKQVTSVPIAELLTDPAMAESSYVLANYVAEKTLNYKPDEAKATQAAIEEGELVE